MLSLNKVRFVTISTEYLAVLNEADSEVFYSPNDNYEQKPFMGIFLNSEGFDYVIPLTSAKQKHVNWQEVTSTNYLIYEDVRRGQCGEQDFYKELTPDNNHSSEDMVRRILSVLEIKKMIPVKDGLFQFIDFNAFDTSIKAEAQRKFLLQKELAFCINIQNDIVKKANKILNKQKESGYVKPFYCSFSLLEEICRDYPV